MYGNSAGGAAFESAMVSMTVQDQVCTVPVYDLGQARSAKKGENFRGFALNRGGDGSVMENDDAFLGAKLRHGALELECFVNRCADKFFNFRFAEGGQNAAP